MGGGTGTGAAHVVARAAKELNILTVGVTTLPFSYEGPKRMRRAMAGLEELKKHLDTVIVVPNQNLFKIASETTTFKNAFTLSNDVLKHGVQSVTDLMVRPGMINLDFADVETVMSSMGKAMMGTGEAEGENRSIAATDMALNNPLIDDYSLKGAKGLLVNITGGDDLTLFEVEESVNKIRAEVDPEAELIFGAIEDLNLNGKMRVSIVATALDGEAPESKTVLNMVNRIQNRNSGYSEGLFSKNTHIENNTYNSISGATALKLDEEFETNATVDNQEAAELKSEQESIENNDQVSGISIENIPYLEKNISTGTEADNQSVLEEPNSVDEQDVTEEYTPPLFADDKEKNLEREEADSQTEDLFDQDINDEEDFEIPAFLRKQKF
jgi:cell division protein FtsZ